jgi:transposase
VLLNYIPYLGPQLIIILDNAFIYKLVYLQELCKHSGVILEFLPLYSPGFNPIEAIFKDLKAWIKRNYTLASRFKSFNNFLKFAIG